MNSNDNIKTGFTLIELIIVIFIISIFVGFGVPKFMEMFFNSAIRQDARKIAMIIQTMRTSAILNKQEKSVVFNLDKHTVEYSTALHDNRTLDVKDVDIYIKEQDKEHKDGKYSIKIMPSGMATPCSIVLKNDQDMYTITIKPFILNPEILYGG